jgi:hypothetical protein
MCVFDIIQEQKSILDEWFENNKGHLYLDETSIEDMFNHPELNEKQLRKYFGNKRTRN